MGVYRRPDSKFWWLYLETTGKRERSQILVGETVAERHDSKALALQVYYRRMQAVGGEAHGLPTPPEAAPPVATPPTFADFAPWYATHDMARHRGAEREREILKRLIADFGSLPLDAITKAVVSEWRTARLATATTVERFGLTSGQPSIWRRLHAALRQRGPMSLADMRALFPVTTRDVCSTIRSKAAAPYFRRVRPGVWAAHGTPPLVRQRYGPPAPRTVNREVSVLKQVLAAAVEMGHLPHSPIYGLANLPIVQPIRRTMNEREEALILGALAPDDAAIMLVGLDTLARLINILELQWADDHGTTLDIRDPKNGHSLTVPVSSRLRTALDRLPRTSPYVFPRRRLGGSQAARRKAVADALKRACRAVDLPYGRMARGLTFHWSTRRTGATRMIRRGGEKAIGVVQRIGGWKDASVLIGIYQETITDEMVAAVESVATGVRPVPPPGGFGGAKGGGRKSGVKNPKNGSRKAKRGTLIHGTFTEKRPLAENAPEN